MSDNYKFKIINKAKNRHIYIIYYFHSSTSLTVATVSFKLQIILSKKINLSKEALRYIWQFADINFSTTLMPERKKRDRFSN